MFPLFVGADASVSTFAVHYMLMGLLDGHSKNMQLSSECVWQWFTGSRDTIGKNVVTNPTDFCNRMYTVSCSTFYMSLVAPMELVLYFSGLHVVLVSLIPVYQRIPPKDSILYRQKLTRKFQTCKGTISSSQKFSGSATSSEINQLLKSKALPSHSEHRMRRTIYH